MTTVAIIGGRLQGIEAAFLAGEAGYRRILIDKRRGTPASGLCEEEQVFDVAANVPEARAACSRADIIIPALENDAALAALLPIAKECGVPLAFDPEAYHITASKLRSDKLIHELGIPAPAYNPSSGYCIVKPSDGSGSEGVSFFATPQEAQTSLEARAMLSPGTRSGMIIQEFIEGPAYSVEVVGFPGSYRTFPVTEIHVDESHDCSCVTTPCELPEDIEATFRAYAIKLAEAVQLHGIMDVEAILSGGKMYVLEIDARLPSQTPAAIYASTGINLLEELVQLFTKKKSASAADAAAKARAPRYAAYENVRVTPGAAVSLGEHIMSGEKPLHLQRNFSHADFALSGYLPGAKAYNGIFITSAETPELLEAKRTLLYNELQCQL